MIFLSIKISSETKYSQKNFLFFVFFYLYLFFASTFWTKLQSIFGHCCMSKLDKVAMG